VIAIFLLAAPRAAAETPDGTLTSVSGTVTITRGNAVPITAAYGTVIESGDRIVTGPGSKVTITLSNGTMQQLSESTTLTLGEGSATGTNGRVTKVSLLTGGAVTLVRFAKGASYEVRTPNAIVRDLGTSYECQYTKGVPNNQFPGCLEFTSVNVYDGTVEVRNSANPSSSPVVAGAGEHVIAPCDLMATLVAGRFNRTELIAGGVIGLAITPAIVVTAYCTEAFGAPGCADFPATPNE
jgi:ferric-dicitrate binding protein FerR (iron transport regulator)